ncbi:MAG: hypothetical protein LBI39_04095, partial [Puniceicoccales bacterium]|nr:hypothetical protein [Puniceicoccales bacterium]
CAIFRTIVGFSFENERSPFGAFPEMLLRTYGRIGWCRHGICGSSSAAGAQSSIGEPFADRNSISASIGFRQKITANWESSGSLNGDLSSHHTFCRAIATVSRSF